MKTLRIAAWLALALAATAAATLVWFVSAFDTQGAVARLQAQVHRATGRELSVGGPVRLRWSWPPEFTAGNVALSNPPGDPRPAMLTVDQVRARLALRPLLAGRAELDVVLVRPVLELDGGNLRFTPEPPPPATGPATPSRPPLIRTELRRVRVEGGRIASATPGPFTIAVPQATATRGVDGALSVVVRVGLQGREASLSGSAGPGGWPLHAQLDGAADAGDVHLAALTLDAPAPGVPVHLKADAAVRGVPLSVDLESTPDPAGDAAAPLRFTLAAAAAGATLTAQGSVDPKTLSGLDAIVSARIPDLPALSPLAGTPLPALGAVSLDGRALAPAGLRAGLAVRSLRLQAAPGNLAGDVALRWAGPPSLRGTLTSTHLDIDALLAAWQRPAPAPPPVPTPPAPAPAPTPAPPSPARVIPDGPLPVAVLHVIDLDLTATLTDVVFAGQPIAGLDAHVTAGNGRARLDPLVVTLAAGRLAGAATVDATVSPPAWSLDVRGPGLHLGRVTDAVHGTADLDASLTATGATIAALAAHLDGRASLRLLDGEIDNRLLAPLLDAALRAAHVGLDLSGRSVVRCLLLPLTAADGTVSTPGLLLDTPRVRVEGEGTADLAAETLALQLRPSLLLGGGASVEAPVRVSGPFAHPAATLGDGSGRTGLRIGLGPHRADPDACGPGPAPDAAPAAPAPAAPAPSRKPADLLRGLLR